MKKKLTTITLALILLLTPGSLLTLTAVAACAGGNPAAGQVLQGIGQTGSDCTSTDVNSALSAVVNILSLVVGAVAVIMIIISGFRYITSNGDSNRTGAAKNTLIYALIGLAIAALAQLLVHFVLYQSAHV